jgi:hypothetical protein
MPAGYAGASSGASSRTYLSVGSIPVICAISGHSRLTLSFGIVGKTRDKAGRRKPGRTPVLVNFGRKATNVKSRLALI